MDISGRTGDGTGDSGTMKSILDVACGSRMFWFNRTDDRAIFTDNRREQHVLIDKSSRGGQRVLTIDPEVLMDFTALPFLDNCFSLVIFDPPHLVRNGSSGWLAKKYGKLQEDWRSDLAAGFTECFRVLKPDGVLIFKWSEFDIPVSAVLALTREQPVIGNRNGKHSKSHWIVFMKCWTLGDV